MKHITRIVLSVLFALAVTYVANAQYYNPSYTRLPGFDANSCSTNEVPTKQSDGTWACGSGGGGGSQTPWTSNIDGGGFNLTNVGSIAVGDTISGSWDLPSGENLLLLTDDTSSDGYQVKSAGADGSAINIGLTQDGGATFAQNLQFWSGGVIVETGALNQTYFTQDVSVRNVGQFKFSANNDATGTADTGICRESAGVLMVSDGSGCVSGTDEANLEVATIRAGDGSETAPGITFSGQTNTGFSRPASNMIDMNLAGVAKIRFQNTQVSLSNNMPIGWASTTTAYGAKDIGLCRESAGTLMVNDGAGCVAGTDEADLLVDEISLADQGTKGTCDSAKAGTIAYEVVTNVGTFHGCQQTGVGTFAWVALH